MKKSAYCILLIRVPNIFSKKLDIFKVSVWDVRVIVKRFRSDKNIIVTKSYTKNIIYKNRSLLNIGVRGNSDVYIL